LNNLKARLTDSAYRLPDDMIKQGTEERTSSWAGTKGSSMRHRVMIEDIEEMRRRQGIDDVELREEICGLEIGDFVKLTLLSGTGPFAGETLLVRITSIKGDAFRGKLAQRPALTSLSDLRAGSAVAFTKAHIHSVPKGQPPHGP
jgi:hypothetical protein